MTIEEAQQYEIEHLQARVARLQSNVLTLIEQRDAALAAARVEGARAMQAACLKSLDDLLTECAMSAHIARTTIAIIKQDIAALDPAAVTRTAKE